MPKRCCVPQCQSNYDSFLKNNKPVSSFSFPKCEERKKQWLRAIPRKDWVPTASSTVCVEHFQEQCIIRTQPYKDPNGTVQQLPLKCPRLSDNAVPTIFKNLPSYLSKNEQQQRTDPESRRSAFAERHENKIQEFLKEDEIIDFKDCLQHLENFLKASTNVNRSMQGDQVWLYILNSENKESVDCGLQVKCSIYINEQLDIKVFLRDVEIPVNDLKWVLPSTSKISKWSQLENLVKRYQILCSESELFENHNSTDHNLILAEKFLKRSAAKNDGHPFQKQIDIVYDQVKLINLKQRRYSPVTIMFAFVIYMISSSSYKFLRNYLILPHKRYLQEISSSLNVPPENNSNHYLKKLAATLCSRERYVCLLVDEIYIKSCVSFKGHSLIGCGEGSNQLAKTVQSFMISSAFGKFKEVVKLVPVTNIKGEQLKDICMNVIQFVQSFGFTVIAIITDNNRINQNMFNVLSATVQIKNPNYENARTFLTYDFVHVFKNIRNNWLNQKDQMKTFLYPDFENVAIIRVACFEHLRMFFRKEQDTLIKKAFNLNKKSLFPSSLERQCVQLVQNVFSDSTIAALSTVPEFKDTVQFLTIIRKWWGVVNSKKIYKGIIKRDKWTGPLSSMNDEKILFLRRFLIWLTCWSNGKKGTLTRDTGRALERCTSVLIKFTDYALNDLKIDYVLPGKLQTDSLEQRFGEYRYLSGCNYNVSFQQILESEKKIRIKKVFKMIIEKEILLKDMQTTPDDEPCSSVEDSADDFSFLLNTGDCTKFEADESAVNYVCGYAAHSVCRNINCNLCIATLRSSKGSDVGDVYYDSLQRGGLSLPSKYVMTAFQHTNALFQRIVHSDEIEKKFLHAKKQKEVMMCLVNRSLEESGFFSDIGTTCECGDDLIKLFSSVVSIFVNVLFNNYCKVKNECVVANAAKKQKLMTLK